MNIDIIATQPSHVDFPYFRWWLHHNRQLFNKIILPIQRSAANIDLSSELKRVMSNDNILFIDQIPPRPDWRDACIHAALEQSSAEYVLFMEQDFLIKTAKFQEFLSTEKPSKDVIGFMEGSPTSRLHPAFLLVKQDLLKQTSMNFSACPVPPEADHFGYVSMDLKRLYPDWTTLENLGLSTPIDWEHLAGLTHNYTLLSRGEYVAFKRPRFIEYNNELLRLPVEQISIFLQNITESASLK